MVKNTDNIMRTFDNVIVKENNVKGIIWGLYNGEEIPQIIVRINKNETSDEFYEFKPGLSSGIFLFDESEITKDIKPLTSHV